MSIRQEYNPEPILEGQILSNEPAMYRTGQYGIRTENVILCEKRMSTEYGNFLGFETITLCPVDQKLVLPELLSAEERIWLNNYHQQVVNELSPLLDEPVKKWLSMQWVPLPIV
jgi:Xaa-Pro aminopeptidase